MHNMIIVGNTCSGELPLFPQNLYWQYDYRLKCLRIQILHSLQISTWVNVCKSNPSFSANSAYLEIDGLLSFVCIRQKETFQLVGNSDEELADEPVLILAMERYNFYVFNFDTFGLSMIIANLILPLQEFPTIILRYMTCGKGYV